MYQPCAKPELTAKFSWWNSKENNEFVLQKFWTTQKKRKSNRPLNPKPIALRRTLFLVLQKDGRELFAGIQLRLTLHHIPTLT